MTQDPRSAPVGNERPRQAHRQARFVVPGADDLEHVLCAACGAKPNGWTPDGTPMYTGGTIAALIQTDRGPYEYVFACRCHAGDQRHAAGLKYFDRASNVLEIRAFPLPIVDDRGQPGPPSARRQAYLDAVNVLVTKHQAGEITDAEYESRRAAEFAELTGGSTPEVRQALADLAHERAAGKITKDQLEERRSKLFEKLGGAGAPTIDDVLSSTALRALYWPTVPVGRPGMLGQRKAATEEAAA